MIDKLPRRVQSGGLPLIKELVARGDYRLSGKVYELLSQGHYELEDLEHSIAHGIVQKTESDEFKDCIGNKKYTIIGPDVAGYDFYTVGKIQRSADLRIYFFITAHEAEVNYE
jgi:hypothetical protein